MGLVLLFLGAVFLIASVANPYRLVVGIPLIGVGTLLVVYPLRRPKILEVRVSWDPSGKLAVQEFKCPYCDAPLPAPKPGQEFIKCPYCGKTIKIVEEPLW